jgi:hypothetical protein
MQKAWKMHSISGVFLLLYYGKEHKEADGNL